jgi:hypothetical protein
MEHNQRANAAYSVDWTDLLDSDDPRERKRFLDPEAARQQVAADLAAARQRLRGAGIHDLEVVGPMRLLLWFAIGANFSSTAGFVVSAQARDGIWTSNTSPCGRRMSSFPTTRGCTDFVGDPLGRLQAAIPPASLWPPNCPPRCWPS